MPKSAPRGPRPVYQLADGTPLRDAIAASGLKPITVYSRIRRGASPDDAVSPDGRRLGRPPVKFLRNGIALCDAVRSAGVSKRCVYSATEAGFAPDDALSAIVKRDRRHFKDGRFLRSS